MFTRATLDYKSAGTLNRLVSDYIQKKENLKSFSGFHPDVDGFKKLLQTNPYADFNRLALSDILLKQTKFVNNTSEKSLQNISQLKEKNTFTVTTGHQLCLFTGPLYFIYKIFSTINLAEQLKKEFPEKDFVPIYWMASEDHDFDEINHFHTAGKTIVWDSKQTGAVGNFKTSELKELYAEIRNAFGKSENSDYLIDLFEKAYLKHATLDLATRFLINELFGFYGLVIVDGNDIAFKSQFKNEFRRDIFENSAFKLVNQTIKKLEDEGYNAQVKPREINCFYIENNLRTRIEKNGETYNLVGTETFLSESQLNDLIENHPEKISPNVVLRPVYQQAILPNLAYVGGPGELAYWLEFKTMFEAFKIVLPILVPRNFVTVIDKPTKKKIKGLKFSDADIYRPEAELIKEFLIKSGQVFNLTDEQENLNNFYSGIIEKINAIDKTLSANISAELQKTLKGIERIATKANRALKRKAETEINHVKDIKSRMFPDGVPQERYENFSTLYIKYGPEFFRFIKANTDPFLNEQNIFLES